MTLTSTYSETLLWCVFLAFLLPLLSFFVSLAIRESFSWSVSMIAPLMLLISAGCACYTAITVWNNDPYEIHFDWIRLGSFSISGGILLNNLSAVMLVVVTLVSFLVHVYSIGYMADDPALKKYFAMLGLFTFSMLGIVLSSSILLIFIFWELVGFSSYMLIGHWNVKPEAAAAAKKAFVMNRIGDAGFLIGLMIIWANTGTFSLVTLQQHTSDLPWNTWATLCLFCGVMGKSAQFPLFTWLPDAMEGPTPVSALIHAATMVAAGVFLLARTSFLFTTEAMNVIAVVGILTALMAALAALVQHDIKKVLAYSTISQLGLMVTAVGAGAPQVAMLHLFTHAFFKACLFLSAGSVIHALHHGEHSHDVHFDVQDIRNLGGLRKKLPFTFLTFVISGSALAGIPFFSGFVSKEAIFTALFNWRGEFFNLRWVILALAFVVSFITVLYIIRLITKVFFGEERATTNLSIHESPKIMQAPMAFLAFLSLWLVVSINPFSAVGWLFPAKHAHSTLLTIFSIGWILLALATGYFLYRKNHWFHSRFLYNNYYLDKVYTKIITLPTLALAQGTYKNDWKIIDGFIHATAYVQVFFAYFAGWVDRTLVDGLVNGAAGLARMTGSFTRSFQGGKIQVYIFWAIFAIIIFLIWSLI